MNIFAFRPFKGKFNLGNSDDIPENQDGTLIGSVKEIKSALTEKVGFADFSDVIANTDYVTSYTLTADALVFIDMEGFAGGGSYDVTVTRGSTTVRLGRMNNVVSPSGWETTIGGFYLKKADVINSTHIFKVRAYAI